MRVGIDVGQSRIGVAVSDHSGLVILPLETVAAHPRTAAVRRIASISRDRNAIEVVVGLPKNMSGDEGPSAVAARAFAAALVNKLPGVRVCLVDERLSTVQAQGQLQSVGVDTRAGRRVIDQMAARIILEQAVELERVGNSLPGETVGQQRISPEGN